VSFFDYPGEPPAAARDTARLLADATDQEWAVVLKHTRYRRFGAGDTVLEAGAIEQSLYLVLEGEMEVLAPHGRRGHNRRIAVVGAGSVIGELSFFDGAARSALVRALTPVVLAELTPADFELLATASPWLARRLLFDLGRILAQRLRSVQQASDTLAGAS
jgi:CRP/FNR family transcriptional regulator, cyclic AMP receptor protein